MESISFFKGLAIGLILALTIWVLIAFTIDSLSTSYDNSIENPNMEVTTSKASFSN